MDAGKKELERLSVPPHSFTISSFPLPLFSLITLEPDEKAILTSVEVKFDNPTDVTLGFTNALTSPLSIADLLKDAASTSRKVSANWSELIDYSANKDEIYDLLINPLDATLRAAKSNMAGQDFLISESGILGRKKEGKAFADEQMILQNNCLLFTNDGWKTLKTALGKVVVGEENGNPVTAYGLVADVIVGNLLVGQNLAIKNSNSTVLIDGNGIKIKNGKDTVFNADINGNALLKGEIKATSGNIGGFLIAENVLKNKDNTLGLSGGGDYLIWAGGQPDEAKFSVTKDGIVKAVGGNIGGYTLTETELIGEIRDTSGKLLETLGMSSSREYAFWAGAKVKDGHLDYGSAPFSVTKNGYLRVIDGSFSGSIEASGGKIGGLLIGGDNMSSGDNGLTITKDGLVIAQQLEIKDYFAADNLKIKKISGRNNTSAYLDFESSGSQQQKITAKCSFVVTEKGTEGFFGAGYKPGNVSITVTTDKKINAAKVFNVVLTYDWLNTQDNPADDEIVTKNIVVAAGSSSATINVAHLEIFGAGATSRYLWLSKVTITPTEYFEDTGVSLESIACNGSFVPTKKESDFQLGTADYMWAEIWCKDSQIKPSDKKQKHNIEKINSHYNDFFDKLLPVSYKSNYGTSDRKHIGFVAQEVKEAIIRSGLTTTDFAGYCEWENPDGEIGCGLRYEEFISLNTFQIQQLKKRIEKLESKLGDVSKK